MDCSPPGSSVHGIFQARVPEWVAIAFSSRHTKKMKKGCYEPLNHLRHRDCEQSNKIDRGMKNFPINKTLGSLSGKESACQCRRGGFDSWFRKTPHAMGQLSPGATTTAPALQSPRAANTGPMGALSLCSTTSRPRSPQLEKCSNEDPALPNKQKLIKKNHYQKKKNISR